MADVRFKVPGKYRRAFNWRVSDGSVPLESNFRGMYRLATSDFPEILEDYLDISRKRQRNWTALSRLQVHLIEELVAQERTVKSYKAKLSDLGAESDPAGLQDREESPEIEFARDQLFFYRLYASACRAIGDGIAWRALEYDRAVTRTMCEHQSKQTLLAEGTIQELREWNSHFERGTGLAIFNALTNCLSVGDVTVVREDGSVEIIEVKSSNTKSGRKVRQRHKMREVVSRLHTGEGQVEGQDIQIEILPIIPETGLDRIEKLLDTAGARGWAAGQISHCLYVEACDLRTIPDADSVKAALKRSRDTVVGEWERRGDFWTEMSTLNVLAFTPNAAPFSIFPFTAKTCVDLLLGAKNYTAYLNVTGVGREFERHGWTVEEKAPKQVTSEQDVAAALERMRMSLMRVTKEDFHAEIPPADFMRLQIEALRPKTLIESCEAIFKLGPREGGFSLTLFDGEAQIWD